MDELNFEGANLDDFKLSTELTNEPIKTEGQVDPAPEGDKSPAPAATDPAPADPAQNADPAPEDPAPAKDEKTPEPVEPPKYDFKDDFIKGVVDYYEKTGDITPYLQAKLVDFAGMSDEDLMRRELRDQYPDVSDKAFDKLYKQQVVDKFKLDSEQFDEDDVELGRELLKSEASKIRTKLVEWQNGFKAPEPKPDNSAAEMQRALQDFEKSVRENEVTKSIMDSKRIAIKTADGEFNFDITDANKLLDMTIDNSKFFGQFAAGEGSLDYAKWYKTVAYSQNPELFEKSLYNAGKNAGREEIAKEIKNPSNNAVGDIPTESSGDFTTGLLKAFAERGVSK